MPDIKLDQPNEKAAAANERPLVQGEKLKQNPERLANGEQAKSLEQDKIGATEKISQTETMAPAAIGPVGGVTAPPAKRQKQVENILAQDLRDIYLNLAPQKQQEFKRAGEETAKKISRLLTKAKINIGEIIKLIKKWLSLIPGINKYFLEQEAKLKADELIKLKG